MSDELTVTISAVFPDGLTYHGAWRDLMVPESLEQYIRERNAQPPPRWSWQRARQWNDWLVTHYEAGPDEGEFQSPPMDLLP